MIYKDSQAHLDKPDDPTPRMLSTGSEKCLNCGFGWAHHNGWACNSGLITDFHSVKPQERYITNSMAASIGIRVWTRPDGSNAQIGYSGLTPPSPLKSKLTAKEIYAAFPGIAGSNLKPGDTLTLSVDGTSTTYTVIADPSPVTVIGAPLRATYDAAHQGDIVVWHEYHGGTWTVKPTTQAKPKPDTDDWRAWAHNVPGECKCGIPIAMCDYHRPTPGR